MTKWLGPAAWSRKEAKAGDRLPYASHVDAATLRLRDGSLMRSMKLAGFPPCAKPETLAKVTNPVRLPECTSAQSVPN